MIFTQKRSPDRRSALGSSKTTHPSNRQGVEMVQSRVDQSFYGGNQALGEASTSTLPSKEASRRTKSRKIGQITFERSIHSTKLPTSPSRRGGPKGLERPGKRGLGLARRRNWGSRSSPAKEGGAAPNSVGARGPRIFVSPFGQTLGGNRSLKGKERELDTDDDERLSEAFRGALRRDAMSTPATTAAFELGTSSVVIVNTATRVTQSLQTNQPTVRAETSTSPPWLWNTPSLAIYSSLAATALTSPNPSSAPALSTGVASSFSSGTPASSAPSASAIPSGATTTTTATATATTSLSDSMSLVTASSSTSSEPPSNTGSASHSSSTSSGLDLHHNVPIILIIAIGSVVLFATISASLAWMCRKSAGRRKRLTKGAWSPGGGGDEDDLFTDPKGRISLSEKDALSLPRTPMPILVADPNPKRDPAPGGAGVLHLEDQVSAQPAPNGRGWTLFDPPVGGSKRGGDEADEKDVAPSTQASAANNSGGGDYGAAKASPSAADRDLDGFNWPPPARRPSFIDRLLVQRYQNSSSPLPPHIVNQLHLPEPVIPTEDRRGSIPGVQGQVFTKGPYPTVRPLPGYGAETPLAQPLPRLLAVGAKPGFGANAGKSMLSILPAGLRMAASMSKARYLNIQRRNSLLDDSDFEGTIGGKDNELPMAKRIGKKGNRFACDVSSEEELSPFSFPKMGSPMRFGDNTLDSTPGLAGVGAAWPTARRHTAIDFDALEMQAAMGGNFNANSGLVQPDDNAPTKHTTQARSPAKGLTAEEKDKLDSYTMAMPPSAHLKGKQLQLPPLDSQGSRERLVASVSRWQQASKDAEPVSDPFASPLDRNSSLKSQASSYVSSISHGSSTDLEAYYEGKGAPACDGELAMIPTLSPAPSIRPQFAATTTLESWLEDDGNPRRRHRPEHTCDRKEKALFNNNVHNLLQPSSTDESDIDTQTETENGGPFAFGGQPLVKSKSGQTLPPSYRSDDQFSLVDPTEKRRADAGKKAKSRVKNRSTAHAIHRAPTLASTVRTRSSARSSTALTSIFDDEAEERRRRKRSIEITAKARRRAQANIQAARARAEAEADARAAAREIGRKRGLTSAPMSLTSSLASTAITSATEVVTDSQVAKVSPADSSISGTTLRSSREDSQSPNLTRNQSLASSCYTSLTAPSEYLAPLLSQGLEILDKESSLKSTEEKVVKSAKASVPKRVREDRTVSGNRKQSETVAKMEADIETKKAKVKPLEIKKKPVPCSRSLEAEAGVVKGATATATIPAAAPRGKTGTNKRVVSQPSQPLQSGRAGKKAEPLPGSQKEGLANPRSDPKEAAPAARLPKSKAIAQRLEVRSRSINVPSSSSSSLSTASRSTSSQLIRSESNLCSSSPSESEAEVRRSSGSCGEPKPSGKRREMKPSTLRLPNDKSEVLRRGLNLPIEDSPWTCTSPSSSSESAP
ncbi:hypothetical protein IE53DRAFT_185705 [Violaceomyces palustris]|uniref:Uncharacterized protein n=1 Tax=Violaceomyces palustris TaxID=1673888 RepID=A0ACD0NS23_9BASI|nr:hypothetical protein IE53DRAFT_185705 [Violaceomyces palustris]